MVQDFFTQRDHGDWAFTDAFNYCVSSDSRNEEPPLSGDAGGSVIPLLTRMARDSPKTSRAEQEQQRQVYRMPFLERDAYI